MILDRAIDALIILAVIGAMQAAALVIGVVARAVEMVAMGMFW